ncbi:hypothetical protein OPQ81_008930 [Rhizoctonia solani]|nr:hypothetical protein OPQ81_008930 [Rhizoctonia solani]
MSDTLEVWNRYLMDDTFASPARIAADWLRNHPNQVDSRRRNQAYSEQTSPALSDTTRPSPSQCDSNYFSPMTVHGEPSRPSNRSNMHLTSLDGSNQYESLFKPSTGVTFFGPSSMGPSSLPYNPNLFRSPAGFDESMNLPSLTDGHALTMFAHHIHSPNTYHATGSGYSSF